MTLSAHTSALADRGRRALVPFFTAGYPDEETFARVVRAAAQAGADVIEIGVPFSDPIADGPAIQAASNVALAGGMSLARALGLAAELSPDISTPFVIMSYINPLLSYGLERFAADARAAGVTGLIAPDVSFEESTEVRAAAHGAGVDFVDLLAPTSSDERIAAIAPGARGFVYLVSVAGVTGARRALSDTLPAFVARVRPHTKRPLYVGFGIATPEHAAEVAASADGVIIGSRLVEIIGEGDRAGAPGRVADFLGGVRAALDNS